MSLSPDRLFSSEPDQRKIARRLYKSVADLPIVSPHGHVDPRLLADPDASFGSPADLFIIPDHYVFRMLYAQGIGLDQLGVQPGGETDHRKVWQLFAESFYLFRGTPTGLWITQELEEVFDVDAKLTGETAQEIYDQIEDCLARPEFRPRALFERFKIEILSTTDIASDPLIHHTAIHQSGWNGCVLPTFRPDAVVNLDAAGWSGNLLALQQASGIEIVDYATFITALENRRTFFKSMGATATDHAALTPYTAELTSVEANVIFQRALSGKASPDEAVRFTGHMLMEMARMSIDDGLVMQIHPGSFRNHNHRLFEQYGPDKGADIPVSTEYTRNLHPLLAKYGNNPRFSLILFTLDETSYSRELAPLAGHYPVIKLGPPWWFHDSPNGMVRYLDQVMETAGLYNTAGFNDDTRAFCSIPARHDVWRRVTCNWLAGLVVRGQLDETDAAEMAVDCAYGLAKKAYHL